MGFWLNWSVNFKPGGISRQEGYRVPVPDKKNAELLCVKGW